MDDSSAEGRGDVLVGLRAAVEEVGVVDELGEHAAQLPRQSGRILAPLALGHVLKIMLD